MNDKTVDFKEGFGLIRAYLCTGSSDWLKVTDNDRPDVKPVKWVNNRELFCLSLKGIQENRCKFINFQSTYCSHVE